MFFCLFVFPWPARFAGGLGYLNSRLVKLEDLIKLADHLKLVQHVVFFQHDQPGLLILEYLSGP